MLHIIFHRSVEGTVCYQATNSGIAARCLWVASAAFNRAPLLLAMNLFACDSFHHSSRCKYSIKRRPCSHFPPRCFYTGLRVAGVIKNTEDQTLIGLSRRLWYPSHRLPDMELVGIWSKWTDEHGALLDRQIAGPPTLPPSLHYINTVLPSLMSLVQKKTTNGFIITWLLDRQNYSFEHTRSSFAISLPVLSVIPASESNDAQIPDAWATKFLGSVRNICRPSVWDSCYVTILATRILRRLPVFLKKKTY
jgi:hypothetical protein